MAQDGILLGGLPGHLPQPPEATRNGAFCRGVVPRMSGRKPFRYKALRRLIPPFPGELPGQGRGCRIAALIVPFRVECALAVRRLRW